MNPLSSDEMKEKEIVIRRVWNHNLESEFLIIESIIDQFPFISMDTEFPGVVHKPAVTDHINHHRSRKPEDNYFLLRSNVDVLNLIQVGLTLTDSSGNLPDLGTNYFYIWEFNFKDFDVSKDICSTESIDLLKKQGMDFEKNQTDGIESYKFAELMMSSGLVCTDSVSWVTFHSAYDFGYLVKILTQRKLPEGITQFMEIVRVFFGKNVYDVKHVMRCCDGLYGGLNQIAKTLHVDRVVGKTHQAGSDSLLTWHAFQRIREIYFAKDGLLELHAGALYGL